MVTLDTISLIKRTLDERFCCGGRALELRHAETQNTYLQFRHGGEECCSQWDRYILLLAPYFAFGMDEIDPTLAKLRQ